MNSRTGSYTVSSIEELEQLYPQPSEAVSLKVIDHLDDTLCGALALSTLCFVATADAQGRQDCSPRGDAAGTVHVLNDKTILLADRPGNNRLDTLRNVIENPEIGLIFLLPGVNEVVRINGVGRVSTDPELLRKTALENNLPRAVLVIEVREAFMHCPRALSSAGLWNVEQHLDKEQRPDFKVMYAAHISINKKKAGSVQP